VVTSPTAWDIAATVVDPEIPVLTIEDLGVLRTVTEIGDRVRVELTPTYSGCPAIEAMTADVTSALRNAGYREIDVRMTLSPAWTTDWMTADGKRKLHEYGITPPNAHASSGRTALRMAVKCPRCDSLDTVELARFGSTSCKALYECRSCLEPFDFFKVL
jgi:ring-1,2-phenylacetyl-CoA epoxidase subunit PaaD